FKILGLILFVSPAGFDAFQEPKSALSRAVECVLIAGLLLSLGRYGWAVLPRSVLHLPVFAYLVVSLVSALLAENAYIAVHGDVTRFEGLAFVGDMAVLYIAVAVACRFPRDWLVIGSTVAAGGIGSIVYAVVQYAGL